MISLRLRSGFKLNSSQQDNKDENESPKTKQHRQSKSHVSVRLAFVLLFAVLSASVILFIFHHDVFRVSAAVTWSTWHDTASSHHFVDEYPFEPPSRSWLMDGQRIGNVDNGLTRQDVHQLIAEGSKGSISNIIGDTVCAPGSPVLSPPLDELNSDSPIDTSRLIYRAIHENQYGPARREAQMRLEHWDEWQRTYNNNIRLFDFECPEAKFLLFEGFTVPVGLGSNLRRWGNVDVFLTALMHRRILIYVAPDNKQLSLVSCPRNDLQCLFLPMTPCVLTKEEMDNATLATKDVNMFLKEHSHERVVRVSSKGGHTTTHSMHERDEVVQGMANTLTDMYLSERNVTADERKQMMDRVINILTETHHNDMNTRDRIEAAAYLFITRPNRAMRELMDDAFRESFPEHYDYSKAVGLPIRGSDKCKREADCITFEAYMKQLENAFPMREMEHIILTSEDENIMAAGKAYRGSIKANMIMNNKDVSQGTGQYLASEIQRRGVSQEAVMTSTMTSWAFQLRSGASFLNLCSNFHILIESSIKFGCGLATTIGSQNVTCNLERHAAPIIREYKLHRDS